MNKFIIEEIDNGIKLDKFVLKHVNANKAFLLMMLRKKQIKVNGLHPKNYDLILKENDEIIFYLDDSCFKKEEALIPRFDIIYEDNNILIIDKEKGMIVHDESHHDLVSLVNSYLSKKNESNASPVNRLDQFTSGLIIFSKNKDTTRTISELIENKSIKKEYLALVKGSIRKNSEKLINYYRFDEKALKAQIYKDKEENTKEIITEYKVLKTNNDLSLLEINLLTGRTHQIRAHMSFVNHPIIGDDKYGDKILNNKLNIHHQELISYRLTFPSNIEGELSYLSNKIFESKRRINFKGI